MLLEPVYSFEAQSGDNEARFLLVFSDKNIYTQDTEDFAFISDGEIIINGTGTVQVIDMLGHVLLTREVTSNSSLLTPNCPGVYMLRWVNGNETKTQKIIIQ